MKDTKPNWQESLGSLKTTKTGAVVFKEYRNGKVVRSVGGNRIEDLVSTLVAFIATERQRVIEEVRGKIEKLSNDCDVYLFPKQVQEAEGFWKNKEYRVKGMCITNDLLESLKSKKE
jgi:hypothetical protein